MFPQAYSISGTVLDSKSKAPINNVNIYIENYTVGTVTDVDGLFILNINTELNSNVHLIVKMIGYKEEHIQFKLLTPKITLGEIHLISESLELESIHIHSHKNKSTQISDISLSGKVLNENLVGNIATTLSNQPNIGVNSYGIVTSKPVLRGYSGDRFLLTKDGNKTGDLSQSSIDHVITLDMTEISAIEVMRGPKSLIYGSNTIGGVINTSISGNPKVRVNRFLKKFLFGGESFNNSIYGNMMFYVPFKNNQINIFLSNQNTKNQTSPIGELDNTYAENFNYKLGYTKYSKDGDYINFIFEKFHMNYGIPPSLEGHINGVDIKLIKNTFQINYHHHISFYNLDQLDVKYNFIDYEHKEFENNSDYFAVALSKNTHSFKIQFQSANLIIGSEFNYKQFSPSGFYWTPKTDELDLSVYGFKEKDFNSIDLLGSFRMGYLCIQPLKNNLSFSNLNSQEVVERNFNYFSSSLGIRKIINQFEINAWLMNTMKAPKIEELYSDGPHLGTYSYEIGKPNLRLEKTYGIESSVRYNNSPVDISLSTFYNYSPYYYQMSKMGECEGEFIIGESHPCAGAEFIEWGSGSSGWLYKYQTKGVESLIKGLEFNLNYDYKNFNIMYDFSLVHGDDLTNEIPLSYINPTKQIVSFRYKKELINYKLRLSHIHSQNRLGEFESYTPSAFLVDLILSYNKRNQNITVQFNNILNEEYYNHLSKIKSIMPEAGRNIVVSYKVFF